MATRTSQGASALLSLPRRVAVAVASRPSLTPLWRFRLPYDSPRSRLLTTSSCLRQTTTAKPAPVYRITTPSKPSSSTQNSSPKSPGLTESKSEPPPETARNQQHAIGHDVPPAPPTRAAPESTSPDPVVDWSRSFQGLSSVAFPKDVADTLLAPIATNDIEVKPDGIIYLPEIKYRRILNKSFGPGGWGMAPRGETTVTAKSVTREYGLVAGGRLISVARGEQAYFDPEGIATATEGCKSNALMRCCKDLGIASELWDPRFVRRFLADQAREVWVEHIISKKRRKITIRKDDEVRYPFKETKAGL